MTKIFAYSWNIRNVKNHKNDESTVLGNLRKVCLLIHLHIYFDIIILINLGWLFTRFRKKIKMNNFKVSISKYKLIKL